MSSTLSSLFARHPELGSCEAEINSAFEMIAGAFRAGNKLLVCGNGGSAADAEHIAGELMKGMCGRRHLPADVASRFSEVLPVELAEHLAANLEPALPTISLAGATSLILAVSNDTDPDMVFAQQVHGYGRPGDVLWAISTSGRSRNVILAAAVARASQMGVVALTGQGGGPLGEMADVCIAVPAPTTAAAQELHRPVYHAICEALESSLTPIE